MRNDQRQANSERGFTLVELMLSVGIFAVMSVGAFSVLSSGQKTAVQNDQTVQVQQNVRLAMDLISRDLRMAGYGNPAAGVLGAACVNHVSPVDSAVGSDSISFMTVNEQVGTVATDFTAGNILRIRGLNGNAPNAPVGAVVTLEGVYTAYVSAFATIDVQTRDVTLRKTENIATAFNISAPQVFLVGTPVLSLACVTYTVTDGAANPPYQLMRTTTMTAVAAGQPAALVDGIESVQFAYALDSNKDGTIDDQAGSAAGVDCLDFIPNRVFLPNHTSGCIAAGAVIALPPSINATPTQVAQIRITVVARAIPPAAANRQGNTWNDPTYTLSSAVNTENVAIPHAPGIRRRTLTKIISLRNAF